MIQTRHLLGAAFAMGAVLTPVLGASRAQPNNGASAQKNVATHSTGTSDDGQHLFEVHCSRCHSAPEGFSPRISGTVVRHMRVRASLSAQEEKELLHFLNP